MAHRREILYNRNNTTRTRAEPLARAGSSLQCLPPWGKVDCRSESGGKTDEGSGKDRRNEKTTPNQSLCDRFLRGSLNRTTMSFRAQSKNPPRKKWRDTHTRRPACRQGFYAARRSVTFEHLFKYGQRASYEIFGNAGRDPYVPLRPERIGRNDQ